MDTEVPTTQPKHPLSRPTYVLAWIAVGGIIIGGLGPWWSNFWGAEFGAFSSELADTVPVPPALVFLGAGVSALGLWLMRGAVAAFGAVLAICGGMLSGYTAGRALAMFYEHEEAAGSTEWGIWMAAIASASVIVLSLVVQFSQDHAATAASDTASHRVGDNETG